ncbi:hypothetical protein OIU85_024696 [Salix viminalis]|uniref:Uncharacterized protein n=1 Tax=Salix viminalis TaxID=40686 RepID=A0A9Q0Z526_SALVM|nr:hypothetical protein OIU85_024696 [Salix viminalis]
MTWVTERICFFDSHPWIESDCEDYLSVDGDFTPSCGTTPIHQGSYIETPPREEPLCIITSARSLAEPSPADMKKQLFELFRENISGEEANGNRSFQDTANGKPITAYLPPKCTSRSPYQSAESSARSSETTLHRDPRSAGKEKPTHSAHCCLPNVVRGLSLSERKKGLSPAAVVVDSNKLFPVNFFLFLKRRIVSAHCKEWKLEYFLIYTSLYPEESNLRTGFYILIHCARAC